MGNARSQKIKELKYDTLVILSADKGRSIDIMEKYITSQKSMDNDQTYKLVLTNQQPKVINQVKQTVGPIATTNKMIRRNGLNHQIGQQ